MPPTDTPVEIQPGNGLQGEYFGNATLLIDCDADDFSYGGDLSE